MERPKTSGEDGLRQPLLWLAPAAEALSGQPPTWPLKKTGSSPPMGLLPYSLAANAEFRNDLAITLDVAALQVIEQPATLTDDLE